MLNGNTHGTVEYSFLTLRTVEANQVARFVTNIGKNTIRDVEATVERMPMTNADERKMNTDRVSDCGLGFNILAQRRRLYKDQFYCQKKGRNEDTILSDILRNL